MDEESKPAGDSPLQWMRELMTMIISVVIMILAAATLWSTFRAAGSIPPDPPAAAGLSSADMERQRQSVVDAYNRQKDVMLYALALFGTVTGYYLGRVPAEANAKRAESAADTAQKQLTQTQDRLTESTATAATATATLTHAQDVGAKAIASLKETGGTLQQVRATLGAITKDATRPGTLSPASEEVTKSQRELLNLAASQLDAALAKINSRIFL